MALFTDSFTGSDGATALDTGWATFGAGSQAAVIRSNRCGLEADNFPSDQCIRGKDHSNNDHFAECIVGSDAGSITGALIAVRCVDRNEYVGIRYDTDRYRLFFQGGGGNQDSYVTALVSGDEIRLQAEGSGTGAYKFYLNDVLRIQLDYSHAAYNSATTAGCHLKTASDIDVTYVMDDWRSGLLSDLGGGGGYVFRRQLNGGARDFTGI